MQIEEINTILSEHQQAEESLGENEGKYRRLFEDSRDAIVINSPAGKFIDFNQAALELFGYTREEMERMNARELYAEPSVRDRFRQKIEAKGAVRDFELKVRKKNGAEIDCLLTSADLCAASDELLDGKPVSMAPTSPPVDLSVTMKAVDGDKALMAELVSVFAQSYARRLIDMREAIMAGDANRTERTAHSLKGEIGLFGATTAYSLAEIIETMGRDAQLDNAPHILQELERELEQVASFLNQPGWGNRA